MDKFVRSEWEREVSPDLLNLYQSFEDRIERLSLLYDGICENAAKNFTKYTTIERDMARHFVAIKETFTELQQENKSLRDDVNYLREKVLEKNKETFKEKFSLWNDTKYKLYDLPEALKGYPNCALSIEQKKHICSAIDKWWEPVQDISVYGEFQGTKDDFLEQLKVLICDTKVGKFIDA